ncbi:MAG: DMT family transporter [Patescibacteria group bacterium]|jgi:drug/metabolite transporter (DMT)-like permease
MSWLLIVTVAYALNAVAMAIDKALLKKEVPRPTAYAFYIAALGIISLVLLPFDWQIPPGGQLIFNLLAGATFTAGLYLMFVALKQADASRVTPFIGGLNPVFIFILAWWFLGERLTGQQILGFLVILAGTFLIAVNFSGKKEVGRAFLVAIPSAVLFAISYTLTKFVYLNQPFISGFVFIRVGAFLAALLFLLSRANRRAIFQTAGTASGGSKLAFAVGQTAGALSMVLVSWAISLASVSLVNGLQGLQYVFLFFIILVLKDKHPELLAENLTPKVYAQKIISIGLIILGLFLISV